ncbi:uncharacterized protein BDZ99DRAFT_279109 [Mytilinidion resinicola]|uniref:Uncharacterized protein n=1 Tax=Mytilinidion resinicola TaxID=574789 RepID=A0A6A6YTH2_9PEZI|nr:uncharacterized protein BDZ99DRAFT_279109 [Mytilinidion resinicola]KAF2811673.1 hypothetical protein BDZ99DRAFT_279109 [Mytilinidion resinicola]
MPGSRYIGIMRFNDTHPETFEALERWIATHVVMRFEDNTSLPDGTTFRDLGTSSAPVIDELIHMRTTFFHLFKFAHTYGNLGLRRDVMISLQQLDILFSRHDKDISPFLEYAYPKLPHSCRLIQYLLWTAAAEFHRNPDHSSRQTQLFHYQTISKELHKDFMATLGTFQGKLLKEEFRVRLGCLRCVVAWELGEDDACRFHEHENNQERAQCVLYYAS